MSHEFPKNGISGRFRSIKNGISEKTSTILGRFARVGEQVKIHNNLEKNQKVGAARFLFVPLHSE